MQESRNKNLKSQVAKPKLSQFICPRLGPHLCENSLQARSKEAQQGQHWQTINASGFFRYNSQEKRNVYDLLQNLISRGEMF